jgi:V/A-type H+/Na+-transporting ATPase subunit I
VGFLRPVPMVKVGLVGLKEDRETVVALLHDLGVLQIDPMRKEASALLEPEHGGDAQRAVADQLLRFRTLKAALPRTPDEAPAAYPTLASVLAAAGEVTIDPEVTRLKREEDQLLTERRQLAATAELLERHVYYREPLGVLRSHRLLTFFGEAPREAYVRLEAEVRAISEAAFVPAPQERAVRFLVAVPAEHADAIGRMAQQAGVRLAAAPALDGPIDEELPRLRARLDAIDGRLGELRGELGTLARRWYPRVAALEEALAIENRKFEAWTRMGAGRSSFALEGWVPERHLAVLEGVLRQQTGDRLAIYRLPTDEEAPTLMDNPPGVKWFEFFIRFYALPRASEFDPTWIFALAFPLFFGFMLGDVGYGVVILTISAWMIAGFPGGRHLPRSLRGFVTMIMGPKGMQMLARTLLPGCALAIGLGAIYNEYFGFHLPFYTGLFDPVTGVGRLLVIAGYIGLGMVSLGFGLGALKAYYHHRPREIVAKVGGIVFAWGVAEVGLAVLHLGLAFGAPVLDVSLAITIAGLGLIIGGEGAQGLMALTEIVSHILSYTRLVGILLSSVILAVVINTVSQGMLLNANGSLALHVGYIVIGAVVLLVGQTFNIILGVFEPGIQGARLIFVEHFSKFYEGNGRPFAPFGSARTHTRARSFDATSPFLSGPPSP